MAAFAEDLGAWVEQALLAERQAVQHDLERRHVALLAELETRLRPFESHAALHCAWPASGPSLLAVSLDCNVPGQVVPDSPRSLSKEQPEEQTATRQDSPQLLPFGSFAEDVRLHGCSHRLRDFVTSPWFETCFALLIICNSIIMAVEAQHKGLDVGRTLNYPGYAGAAVLVWPGAAATFDALEWWFGCVFILEVLVKILALRMDFARDAWNWIDTALVSLWLIGALSSLQFPLNFMLLRLARLLRLLRLLKLVRSHTSFDPLFLMTTAMRGSIGVLLWTVVFILLVQVIFAICIQTMLDDYIRDESNPHADRIEVYKFYGTFARAVLTMFEITLGNWMPPCRALVENVSEWWMVFSLVHKLVVGFSMVSVITGVFIQETFKVASMDDMIMMRHQEQANKTHKNKMQTLFELADPDGNGLVTLEEFVKLMSHPSVRTWLSAMALNVSDAEAIFKLLDPGAGRLHFEDVMRGVARLKGNARSVDLIQLQCTTRDLIQEVQQSQSLIRRLLMNSLPMPRMPLPSVDV